MLFPIPLPIMGRHVLTNGKPTSDLRRLMVAAAGYKLADMRACSYVVVPGDTAPVKTGNGGGHYTLGGAPIAHPSAYSKRGWSNMVYQTSTRTVTCGLDWLVRAWEAQVLARREQKRRCGTTMAEVAAALAGPRNTEGVRYTCEGGYTVEPSGN